MFFRRLFGTLLVLVISVELFSPAFAVQKGPMEPTPTDADVAVGPTEGLVLGISYWGDTEIGFFDVVDFSVYVSNTKTETVTVTPTVWVEDRYGIKMPIESTPESQCGISDENVAQCEQQLAPLTTNQVASFSFSPWRPGTVTVYVELNGEIKTLSLTVEAPYTIDLTVPDTVGVGEMVTGTVTLTNTTTDTLSLLFNVNADADTFSPDLQVVGGSDKCQTTDDGRIWVDEFELFPGEAITCTWETQSVAEREGIMWTFVNPHIALEPGRTVSQSGVTGRTYVRHETSEKDYSVNLPLVYTAP